MVEEDKNGLDKSIIDKIDKSFEDKAKEVADKTVEDTLKAVMEKYDAKINELNENFNKKLENVESTYKKELETKDGELSKVTEDFNTKLDKISSRQSISADDAGTSEQKTTKEDYIKWYRSQPNEVKAKEDQQYFDNLLAKQGYR